ncbi:MAG: hypothetical protein VYD19_01940 [Myxococcota bacterium]|nr:hypothetical protein [Myxococcota bacterium]
MQPTSALRFGYDDNIFYDAAEEPDGRVPNAGWLLVGEGQLRAQTREQSAFRLSLDSKMSFRHYLSADNTGVNGTVISDEVIAARTGVAQAAINGDLRLNPRGSFQTSLYNQLNYMERPSYESALYGFERLQNIAGARLHFMPGGQGVKGPLEMNIGYGFEVIDFLQENQGELIIGRSEKSAHRFSTETKLRFLPKNYLLLEASYVLNDYNDFAPDEEEGEVAGSQALSRDSRPFRATAGITGLITPRVSMILNGGYTHTFNDNGPSFKGFIGLVELSYVSLPFFRLGAGYQRDGRDSGFSNFYVLDRGFLRMNWSLSERLVWNLLTSYDLYRYERTGAIENQGREDPVIRLKTGLSTRLASVFYLKLSWSLEENMTEYRLPIGSDSPTDLASYRRQVYLLELSINP